MNFNEMKSVSIPCLKSGEPLVDKNTGEELGYKFFDGCLVPFTFLNFLANYLRNVPIVYGSALSPSHLFSEEVWEGFDDYERHVALPCVMFLIGLGAVAVTVPENMKRKATTGPAKH